MSTADQRPHGKAGPRSVGSIVGLMIALLAAIFAFQLNASMLSPVLVTMEHDLGSTAAQIGLTQTAFFAAAALFSLFLPRWGDLVGRRRIMLGMLAVTAVGCAISALAPNIAVLGVGRVVQGVSGPIVPMALIMLHVQVPDRRRYASLMAVLTAVNGGIAGVDALLGGWLAGTFGFRAVFWTMALVALIAFAGVWWACVESRSARTVPMDWKGVIALVVVLASLYFAFDQAGRLGEANWGIVGGLVLIGIGAFWVFWRIEAHREHPLVSTHYMRQRRTWALLLTTLLTMTGVFAVMNGLIPNLAQDVKAGPGIGAAGVSWWTLTPYAIAGLVMGPVAGQLAARLGFRVVLQCGLVLTVIGLLAAVLVAGDPLPILLLVLSVVIGVTYAGTCNIMLNGLGIVLSPADNQGYLPGMNSGAFNLGAGLSYAILFAVQSGAASALGITAGYRAGTAAGAVLLLLALGTSFLIPKPENVPDAAADSPDTEPTNQTTVVGVKE
ncbi:MFS transporter [Brachybacterium endophyticum]|uniref:MFS transporter n=1 Tax=Brachybacterium endophyticum TaxID=2182385 RepID=A0A2U2RNL6_9MICO|nr:MFS transporter [Brachybacterium endophyticum]PWH07385.1 MFS transporter [Brachybacterium endophyticum]